MTKPKLSFWQIWNLSFGFLGVQIGYSLQNSNTSSIFESLGADVSHLSYFWLAAPLAGMIVQPIVGLFSDGTWTRWGRRIPYILGGSLISALALVLMPNCPKLLAFAPLAMGAFILLFMDLSFNVTMQPFRALVADMLDDSQKTQGYVVQTFLINLGAVVGAILPLVMTWLGVSDEAAPGHVSPHIAYSYYAGGAILLLTVLVTSFKTREYPPGEFARYNNLSEEDAKPVSFVGLMRNVPGVMVRLGVTQFFSWAALFLMWTYLKPAITGVVTDHATGEVLSAGATQTWVGVLNGTYPIPACIAALFLGPSIKSCDSHKVVKIPRFPDTTEFGIINTHNRIADMLKDSLPDRWRIFFPQIGDSFLPGAKDMIDIKTWKTNPAADDKTIRACKNFLLNGKF